MRSKLRNYSRFYHFLKPCFEIKAFGDQFYLYESQFSVPALAELSDVHKTHVKIIQNFYYRTHYGISVQNITLQKTGELSNIFTNTSWNNSETDSSTLKKSSCTGKKADKNKLFLAGYRKSYLVAFVLPCIPSISAHIIHRQKNPKNNNKKNLK